MKAAPREEGQGSVGSGGGRGAGRGKSSGRKGGRGGASGYVPSTAASPAEQTILAAKRVQDGIAARQKRVDEAAEVPYAGMPQVAPWQNPMANPWAPGYYQGFSGRTSDAKGSSYTSQAYTMPGGLTAEDLLGHWADSLGNSVHVFSEDAYQVRLLATLSQPPRKDVHLKVRPMHGGTWICGNAALDMSWSSTTQLHWLAADGRISVWVRPHGYQDFPESGQDQNVHIDLQAVDVQAVEDAAIHIPKLSPDA